MWLLCFNIISDRISNQFTCVYVTDCLKGIEIVTYFGMERLCDNRSTIVFTCDSVGCIFTNKTSLQLQTGADCKSKATHSMDLGGVLIYRSYVNKITHFCAAGANQNISLSHLEFLSCDAHDECSDHAYDAGTSNGENLAIWFI